MIKIEIKRPLLPTASRQAALAALSKLQGRFAAKRFEFDGLNPVHGYLSVGKNITVGLYQPGDKEIDATTRVQSDLDEGTVKRYAEDNL